MLLNKHEILEIWRKAGDGHTWGEYAEALNKEQLKKVVEWLNNNTVKAWGGNRVILDEDLKALLKEIE